MNRDDIHVVIHPFPGPPTQEKAYRALLAAELEAAISGSDTVGAAHVINNGLRLERDQCAFSQRSLRLSFTDIG